MRVINERVTRLTKRRRLRALAANYATGVNHGIRNVYILVERGHEIHF